MAKNSWTESRLYEKGHVRRRELSAYYTAEETASALWEDAWPGLAESRTYSEREPLRIIEPSAGTGNIASQILLNPARPPVDLKLFDIDGGALDIARQRLAPLTREGDRLSFQRADPSQFDAHALGFPELVIGNPPFGRHVRVAVTTAWGARDAATKFLSWALGLSAAVSLVLPKVVLNNLDARPIRQSAVVHRLHTIQDFGEKAFSDVKIETVGLHFGREGRGRSPRIRVRSVTFGTETCQNSGSLSFGEDAVWLPYRNDLFDEFLEHTEAPRWSVFRDRSISRSMTSGKARGQAVLQARNISPHGRLSPADRFLIDESDRFVPAGGAMGIVVPNLSYYPRGAFFENAGEALDGSAALLFERTPGRTRVEYEEIARVFASDWFFAFYRIARSFSRRSLNVDAIHSQFWRVPKRARDERLFRRTGVANAQNVMRDAADFLEW